MVSRIRIAVLLSVAAGILAQPAAEAGRARAALTESKVRTAGKPAGEKKADRKKESGRKSNAGAPGSGPIAVLSPDVGAGKTGGGVQKSVAVHWSAGVCAELALSSERVELVVGFEDKLGRLHRPTHFALAPPRAPRLS